MRCSSGKRRRRKAEGDKSTGRMVLVSDDQAIVSVLRMQTEHKYKSLQREGG